MPTTTPATSAVTALTPYLTVRGAAAAIDWYREAFGAVEELPRRRRRRAGRPRRAHDRRVPGDARRTSTPRSACGRRRPSAARPRRCTSASPTSTPRSIGPWPPAPSPSSRPPTSPTAPATARSSTRSATAGCCPSSSRPSTSTPTASARLGTELRGRRRGPGRDRSRRPTVPARAAASGPARSTATPSPPSTSSSTSWASNASSSCSPTTTAPSCTASSAGRRVAWCRPAPYDPANVFDHPPGEQSLYVVTAEPHAVWERCRAAGVDVVREPEAPDHDPGGMGFSVRDPEGNIWSFGTYGLGETS